MRSRIVIRAVAVVVGVLCIEGWVRAGSTQETGKDKSPRSKSGPPLQWLEYGKALERARSEDKHVLIDFYTNWCKWCKVMDFKTYGDSSVAAYLHQHFVLSKVNAESPEKFKVGEDSKSGIELAGDFGVRSFPITWFLKPDGSPLDRVQGYVPPHKFMRALVYVHERTYEEDADSP